MTEIAGEPVDASHGGDDPPARAGEDPERIEEDLGDALEQEMGEDGGGLGAAPTRDDGLYPM